MPHSPWTANPQARIHLQLTPLEEPDTLSPKRIQLTYHTGNRIISKPPSLMLHHSSNHYLPVPSNPRTSPQKSRPGCPGLGVGAPCGERTRRGPRGVINGRQIGLNMKDAWVGLHQGCNGSVLRRNRQLTDTFTRASEGEGLGFHG